MKLVSKMRFHQRNTHFRLENSVRKNRTTFPDVPGWARKFSANTTLSYVLFYLSPWGRSHLSNHVVRRGSYQKNKLDTSDYNSPPPPARNGQKNGPQSLDANDVMDNARGLPSGDVEDSNRPFRSFPGPLFQNESRCSAFDMVDCTTRFVWLLARTWIRKNTDCFAVYWYGNHFSFSCI